MWSYPTTATMDERGAPLCHCCVLCPLPSTETFWSWGFLWQEDTSAVGHLLVIDLISYISGINFQVAPQQTYKSAVGIMFSTVEAQVNWPAALL